MMKLEKKRKSHHVRPFSLLLSLRRRNLFALSPLFLGERTQPHFLSRESHATNCEIGSPHAAVGAVQPREGAVREVLGLVAAIEVTVSPSKVFTHVRAGDI